MSDEAKKTMTTAHGRPIGNNQHSKTAGPRGPILGEDVELFEKMAHFNRERVPERVVHAKGYGAYGTFRVTQDVTRYTKAKIFSEVGKETPMFARFSTVGGESGSADTARDPRGFALKFYTDEGNWDLVGNNTPIFFVRDPLKFSDFIRTQKREPRSHLKPHWMRWDFWSLVPESMHQVMVLYSDRGTPKSARFMHGYGSHTFSFINDAGERHWVKFHIRTQQGVQNFSDAEATKMAGEDPDYSSRDLYQAIEEKNFPKWTVSVQIMPETDADNYGWHPFDLTKVWSQRDYPLIEVGEMELNRNPEDYFAEVEQAAFEPGNIVPGIGFSPDKMLQNRLISYKDAHHYRIGINYDQVPVNRPQSPVNTYHRDGAMRTDGNYKGAVNYEPNSFGGPAEDRRFEEPPLKLSGDAARYNSYACDAKDYYGQPRDLWEKVLDEGGRQRLVENIVGSMDGIPQEIQLRQLYHFHQVHEDFGSAVATGLGLEPSAAQAPEYIPSAADD